MEKKFLNKYRYYMRSLKYRKDNAYFKIPCYVKDDTRRTSSSKDEIITKDFFKEKKDVSQCITTTTILALT